MWTVIAFIHIVTLMFEGIIYLCKFVAELLTKLVEKTFKIIK
jgi:hypothetical protein